MLKLPSVTIVFVGLSVVLGFLALITYLYGDESWGTIILGFLSYIWIYPVVAAVALGLAIRSVRVRATSTAKAELAVAAISFVGAGILQYQMFRGLWW